MSVTDQNGGWGEVERLARQHEASVNEVMTKAGLPLIHISIEDRKNGAIIAAMGQIKAGDYVGAWNTLNEGFKL